MLGDAQDYALVLIRRSTTRHHMMHTEQVIRFDEGDSWCLTDGLYGNYKEAKGFADEVARLYIGPWVRRVCEEKDPPIKFDLQ